MADQEHWPLDLEVLAQLPSALRLCQLVELHRDEVSVSNQTR